MMYTVYIRLSNEVLKVKNIKKNKKKYLLLKQNSVYCIYKVK